MDLNIMYQGKITDIRDESANDSHDCLTLHFKNGINFIQTQKDNNILERLTALFNEKGNQAFDLYVDDRKIQMSEFRKLSYSLNYNEMSFLNRKRKLKSMIKGSSTLTDVFEISDDLLNTRFESLWHYSYLCSLAVGLSKNKKIFLFPYLPCKECFIQVYRLNLICSYADSDDMIAIIPTDNVTYHGANIECAYNLIKI
ncbi:MAG: hypothetical protein Q4F95_16315 [Oscillospiraceae bacterium]|nr:hypothetical protein [Oscillospiraceae bacterium]